MSDVEDLIELLEDDLIPLVEMGDEANDPTKDLYVVLHRVREAVQAAKVHEEILTALCEWSQENRDPPKEEFVELASKFYSWGANRDDDQIIASLARLLQRFSNGNRTVPHRDRVIQLESLIAHIGLIGGVTEKIEEQINYVTHTSIANTIPFQESRRLSPNVKPLEVEIAERATRDMTDHHAAFRLVRDAEKSSSMMKTSLEIIAEDRDEWKKRALAAEEKVRRAQHLFHAIDDFKRHPETP